MDSKLLKLSLRGSSCDNCCFKLAKKLDRNSDLWCRHSEIRPDENICQEWQEKDLDDYLYETTSMLIADKKQRSIKVKVKNPTKLGLERWS